MHLHCGFVRTAILWVLVAGCPAVAFAQASIAGVVRDTSQAVLPGVTVEASSPALIEKVRSVVTDGAGVYRITDLRPGTYTVTFTLPGFSVVKRDGVVLTGDATFQVNADLRVGALEETITVTGAAPVVDVQNTRTQAVIEQNVLANLPSTRNYQSLQLLMPGVTIAASAQDVGGTRGALAFFSTHGGDVRDSDILVGGMSFTDTQSGGGRSMYVPSTGETAEVTTTTSGGLGEARRAGTVVNMVPREGGNLFAGNLYLSGASGGMQANNISDELIAKGFRAPGSLRKVFDYEGIYGGPIRRDRLWFLGKVRYNGFDNWVPGMFQNRNAGDPTKWTYEADLSKPSSSDKYWLGASMRLTWQATARNKLSVYYEDQLSCTDCGEFRGGGTTTSPEAAGRNYSHPNNLGQVSWSAPVTSRLLLEAGVSIHQLRWGVVRPSPDQPDTTGLIRVQEQAGLIPGVTYRALGDIKSNWIGNHFYRAAVSYITGSHTMKFGMDGGYYELSQETDTTRRISYRLNNGVPNQLTMEAYPIAYFDQLHDFGIYGQDQWVINRLTLGVGIRYDTFHSSFPGFSLGPSTFVPTPVVFPDVDLASLHDITPRINVAYDLFGDGRTALKLSLGKYVISQNSHGSALGGLSAVGNRIAATTNRSWTDGNSNFNPDCDLLNPVANGECGPWANANFGKAVVDTFIDPEVARGWGVRPYNWNFDVGVQRELLPGLSTTVTYFRRWFGNLLVTDNRALTVADHTFFDLPLPADPRLPISGTVNGFFNVVPSKFGVFDNLVTSANNYGGMTQNWHGVDVLFTARLGGGLSAQGGVSTGRAYRNMCEVARNAPSTLLFGYENGGTGTAGRAIPMAYCEMKQAMQTQFKALGAYTIPRVDVQLSASLQAVPGRERNASYNAPNAVVAPLIGRPLSGNAANVNLQLLPPQQFYGDRINLLDVRVGKILRFGSRKAQISLDFFNTLNSSVVLSTNDTYNPTGTWEIPTGIAGGRLIKITGQLDF